jgi:hypothetical protein
MSLLERLACQKLCRSPCMGILVFRRSVCGKAILLISFAQCWLCNQYL